VFASYNLSVLVATEGNSFCWCDVEGTKTTTSFLIRKEYIISQIKGLHRTTPDGSGALESIIPIPTRSS
jgi:hypothetical protein